jgi:hypothetical protein
MRIPIDKNKPQEFPFGLRSDCTKVVFARNKAEAMEKFGVTDRRLVGQMNFSTGEFLSGYKPVDDDDDSEGMRMIQYNLDIL